MTDRSEWNYVRVIGYARRDNGIRILGSGKRVLEISLSIGSKERPNYIGVTCWDELADSVDANIGDGARVKVEGHLDMDQWTDKQSGQTRRKHKLTAKSVDLVARPTATTAEPAKAANPARQPERPAPTGDDIPF